MRERKRERGLRAVAPEGEGRGPDPGPGGPGEPEEGREGPAPGRERGLHSEVLEGGREPEGGGEGLALGRRRAFGILGWALCGFAVLAGSAFLIERFAGEGLAGGHWAWLFVALAAAGFLAKGVFAVAGRLSRCDGIPAHMLLWGSALLYALLLNVLVAAGEGDALAEATQGGEALRFASLGLHLGLAFLAVLAASAAVGFGGFLRGLARWSLFAALGAGLAAWGWPDPALWEAWAAGAAAGMAVAWLCDRAAMAAARRPDIPGPALAACLVAGCTSLVPFLALMFLLLAAVFALRGAQSMLEAQAAQERLDREGDPSRW